MSTTETDNQEQRQEVTLTKEQSDELLKRAGNMVCIACPYFEMYNVDVRMGFVGRCAALHGLGEHRGGGRGWFMRFTSRYMWTMIVDRCSYRDRYDRLLLNSNENEKGGNGAKPEVAR